MWKPRATGEHLGFSTADFTAGWGGFTPDENPNWACVVSGKEVQAPPVDTGPSTQPATPQPATPPPPTPTPVAPLQPAQRMEDVNRRIRALAAFRWAEAPNFDDPESVKVWRDNLGDWGLEYDKYVVQSGDTLAGLAARFYGEQHRWHAIQIYNDLGREGLWLGETLLIPHLGKDNAHLNPALPHDTTDFAKALEFGLLIDPDLPAMDYMTQTGSTKGIGYIN